MTESPVHDPVQPCLGFVGLGDQGGPIARRLIDAGFEVRLWARKPAALDPFRVTSAIITGSLDELGRCSDIVGICVVDDAGVTEIVSQLLPAMRAGSVIVVHSTVSPDTCRRLDCEAQRSGVRLIDAPVSGGAAAAREGKLSVVVGADMDSFTRCQSVFAAFASQVLRLGDVGAGQSAKLINNALMAANIALAQQAFALGDALGIDRDSLGTYLKSASGRSFSLEVFTSLPS